MAMFGIDAGRGLNPFQTPPPFSTTQSTFLEGDLIHRRGDNEFTPEGSREEKAKNMPSVRPSRPREARFSGYGIDLSPPRRAERCGAERPTD